MEKYKTIKVGSVMSYEFHTIAPTSTIDDAVMLMSDKDTSLLVVVNKENFPVGILTERDIVVRVLGHGKKPSKTSVEEIMTSPIRTCDYYMPISGAMKQMAKTKVRQLLVVKNGILVGVFLARDAFNVAPDLIEVLGELVSIRDGKYIQSEEVESGYCEDCEDYFDVLKLIDGRYLCEYCKESLKMPNMRNIHNILLAKT
jgi:CBS domain-containing protein